MTIDDRQPVLVGVAARTQRVEEPGGGLDAVGLLAECARAAALDAGAPGLLDRVDLVLLPEGTWRTDDAGHLLGAPASARSVLARIGVLQQTLLGRAAADIAAGRADVVLVAGAEDKYRAGRAARAGVEPAPLPHAGRTPDEVLVPAEEILLPAEIERELAWPVRQYAVMETALRASLGRTVEEHAADVDARWAGFHAVAAANPEAWNGGPLPPEGLRPSAANPTLSTPYTKLHVSQWNVDQAAALLLCSAGTARALGVPLDRWLFPLAGIESNHMLPLAQRAEPGRSVAVDVAGEALLARTGVAAADAGVLELYSCFPVAVGMQVHQLGVDPSRPLTVTGGMTFGGGPLNNYTLQATVAMARRLREEPAGTTGLVTNVSGMLTKFGLSLWSSSPPAGGSAPYAVTDVTAEVEARAAARPVDPDLTGPATVVGYTVVHEGGAPAVAVVLAEADGGARTVACCREPDVAAAMTSGEWVGTAVDVDRASFRPR